VVPLTSCLPLCLYMYFFVHAPLHVMLQIVMAAFMGTAVVLLMTFFLSERWMVHVTRYLLERGVAIPFDSLPATKLSVRLTVCFILTIVVATLMIGALANQRALDIIRNPAGQAQAVV